jgi:hypothetical protein
MRVCPECGHVDPPEWRHSRYSYWIDFCDIDHFKALHPELHKRLMSGEKLVEDRYYIYRLTKNKSRVERKALVDYGYQWNIPMEKKKANRYSGTYPDFDKCWDRDVRQTKLELCEE